MSDQHRPRFVVPAQGGRFLRRRAGDADGVPPQPPETPGPPSAAEPSEPSDPSDPPESPDPSDPPHPPHLPGSPGPPATGSGEDRFRALFDPAPVGVALSSPEGGFVVVNPALRELLLGTEVDPDVDGLPELVRHLPQGADEARAWREGLRDVREGRAPVARAELAVAPVGSAPRWVRVTTALVELAGQRYLLSHVEETTGLRLAGERREPLARVEGPSGPADPDLLVERLGAARARQARSGLAVAVLGVELDASDDPQEAVVEAVGRRLRGLLRVGDTAGRIGRAAFAVVAPDVPDGGALDRLVDRLVRGLADDAGGHDRVEAVDGTVRRATRVGVGGALVRPGDTFAAVFHRATEDLAARRDRPAPPAVDLRETDLRETDQTDLRGTDLRGTGAGNGGTDGEAPLAERPR